MGEFFVLLINIYLVICVVRIVMSWLDVVADNSILSALGSISYSLTEPVFATVRRILPPLGDIPIDPAPMLTMLVLFLLRGIVS